MNRQTVPNPYHEKVGEIKTPPKYERMLALWISYFGSSEVPPKFERLLAFWDSFDCVDIEPPLRDELLFMWEIFEDCDDKQEPTTDDLLEFWQSFAECPCREAISKNIDFLIFQPTSPDLFIRLILIVCILSAVLRIFI